MKAIIFKELRETGKWALLLAVLFAGALWWSVGTWGEFSIVRDQVIGVCMIGCATVAFALGTIQFAYDWPMARWAFIIHRPISRSRIFWAKTLAGLAMYSFVTLIPLLGALVAVLLPWPGHTPFSWNMTLPAIALWFHGILYYFAAIIIGTRDARWFGTRIVPLGGVGLLSIVAIALTINFTEVLLIVILSLCIVVPAAHGGFISAGLFHRQPVLARLTHILTLAACSALALYTLGGFADQAIRSIPRMPSDYYYQSYRIDLDGRVTRTTYSNGGVNVTDTDGNPLLSHPRFHSDYEHGHEHPGLYLEGRHSRRPRSRGQMPHWNSLSYLWPVDSRDGQRWYYVSSRRIIEGVNLRSGVALGKIGSDGLGANPTPFSEPLIIDRAPLIIDAHRVHLLDTVTPSILVWADVGTEREIIDAAFIRPLGREPGPPPMVFVMTRDSIQAFEYGTFRFKWTIPPDSQISNFAITPTRQGTFALLYYQNNPVESAGYRVLELSTTGDVIQETTLPKLQSSPPDYQLDWTKYLRIVFTPPVLQWILVRHIPQVIRSGIYWPEVWIFPLGGLAVVLVCTADVLVLRKRLKLTGWQTMGWIILSIIFGFAAILALHMTRPRPLRITCLQCGKLRTLTDLTCDHCTATHATPARTGIEIFELMPAS